MIEFVETKVLRPATYNPRSISPKEFEDLVNSIWRFGFVLPIIANAKNNVIVAGHQRLRAAESLGLKTVPVFWVADLNVEDEIKFNQLHNGTSRESGGKCCAQGKGFCVTKSSEFKALAFMPTYVKEISKIIMKYGNVLSCVVCDGEVVYGSDYVKACQLMGMNVNTFFCLHKAPEVKAALNANYGKFSYAHLEKDTFVQGLAQLHRLSSGKQRKSVLYEKMVIPWLRENRSARVLDFGAGKAEYAKRLSQCYRIIPVEFYPNDGRRILVGAAQDMVDRVVEDLRENGRFDAIVLDAVLNSVDCPEAERYVLDCCNALLRSGGMLFASGRPLDAQREKLKMQKDRNVGKRFIEFIDDDKFTANFRMGHWYYQHFHDKEDIQPTFARSKFLVKRFEWRRHGDSWQIESLKVGELSPEAQEKSIRFEFDLPLPNGESINRAEDVLIALREGWARWQE